MRGELSWPLIEAGEQTRKPKRSWYRAVFEESLRYGMVLLDKLKQEEATGFQNFTRLPLSYRFRRVASNTRRRNIEGSIKFREKMPFSFRLVTTLRFSISGDSFTSPMYTFKISMQAISLIFLFMAE